MTWRTQIGERTLKGAEANLIREALATMVDMVEEEIRGYADQWEFDVPLFDQLPPTARLAILAQVGWALLRETETYPPLTAINEATVAAIFERIKELIQFEVDSEGEMEDPFNWRRDVLAVYQEIGDDDLPSVECRDMEEWDLLVQVLSDRILWDEDFNDAVLYVDKPPEHAQFLKEAMMIDDDYFTAVPPDPREADLPRIREIIRDLLQG